MNLQKLPESNEGTLIVVSEDKTERYSLRFDGCVHIERWFNGGTCDNKQGDRDYLHVCDLADFIETLQELKRQAESHFGGSWPQ